MSLVIAGRIARGGTVSDGWVEVEGERIAAIGRGSPSRPAGERIDGVIAPGLFDLQVNGAGGHEVAAGPAALDAIDAVQLAHGVTGYLPTLISPDDPTAERVLRELAERATDPTSPAIGAHVEGPFLNPEHAGMHPPERLRAPSDGVPAWLDSPAVRMVTLAPELAGALDLVERLAGRGVVVSLGHSGADAATAEAAIDAGATMITHVFNGMAPFHHRAPGLVGVALTDDRVGVGVIADGVHLDPLALEIVRRAAGQRAVLVSDATPAAAAPPRSAQSSSATRRCGVTAPARYEMAGVEIELADAGARTLAGALAGSTLTLDAAVRGWATLTGATLAEAIAAASGAPAAVLGLPEPLAAGSPADLCVLDDRGGLMRVMQRGRWISQ